jgi:hypothetical protein
VQAEIMAVRVGDLLLGVRSNDDEVAARLRTLLAPHLDDGIAAPPNISVVVGKAEPASPVRALHTLHRGPRQAVSTSAVGRLLRAVPYQLDGYLPPPNGSHRLDAAVLVGDHDAILVSRRFADAVTRAEARLGRIGYRIADVPWADLDDTGTIEFRAPAAGFVPDEAAALDRQFPATEREVRVPHGRRPVRAIVAPGPFSDSADGHPAERLAAATSLLPNTPLGIDGAALDLLAGLVTVGRLKFRPSLTDKDVLALGT